MESLQTATAPENPNGAALAALERPTTHANPPPPVEALLLWMAQQGFDPTQQAAITTILGMTAPGATQVSWDQFKSELREQYTPQLRSRSTRKGVDHALGMLESLGAQQVRDINVRLIARVVSTRDKSLSPHSVRSLLAYISSIASHAVTFGYLPVSPFVSRPIRTWVRPGKRPQGRHLTKDEIRRIFDVLRLDVEQRQGWAKWRARRLQALVTLLGWTGLRISEAQYLHTADLDFDQHIINLTPRAEYRLKTEKAAQPLIMLPPLEECLRNWVEHRNDGPPGLTRAPSPFLFPNIRRGTPWRHGVAGTKPLDRFKAVARRAGVPDANFMMVRRAVGTHLEAAGAGPAMIQRILRHSNETTAELYYRKTDLANMREAMKNFTY